MPASTDYYPYPIDDDGCATCYTCNGEGQTGNIDTGVRSCSTCDGAGFVQPSQVARYILSALDEERTVTTLTNRHTPIDPDIEEPF